MLPIRLTWLTFFDLLLVSAPSYNYFSLAEGYRSGKIEVLIFNEVNYDLVEFGHALFITRKKG
jgi:hypothetical protein